MTTLAIVEAFAHLPDPRRGAGQRHSQALCLALFTLAVAAGCRGFLAIGDWLTAYHDELVELFAPPKRRLPSYSTIRRVLLNVDYEQYSVCLARFFQIQPRAGEMIAVDGKHLRGSYQIASEHCTTEPHPAIQLVSVYLVERGLILEPFEVERKSNEIKVLPELVKQFAQYGVVFGFDAINTQKKLRLNC
nr:ISAs1 family transposase [Leptolyngbya ohadii]